VNDFGKSRVWSFEKLYKECGHSRVKQKSERR